MGDMGRPIIVKHFSYGYSKHNQHSSNGFLDILQSALLLDCAHMMFKWLWNDVLTEWIA